MDTLTLARVPLEYRVRVSGIVEPRTRVELFAEEGGRVLEVGAEDLDIVEAGQLLVRIDPLAGEVEVARSEALAAQAESELSLARANLERQKTLATSRVASESDLDTAVNTERVAVAVHRAAKASLRDAHDRLAKRTVLAPFGGVLRGFDVEAGEYVTPGQRLGELLDASRVRVRIGLRDRDVVAVSPGALAEVEVEARPGEVFTGTVLRVAGAADEMTHKFPVEVEVENPGGRLLPGMVARVRLKLGGVREARLVPRDAVLDRFGLFFVYVVHAEPEGAVVARQRRVAVKSVPFRPGELEVTEGLDVGERIVTSGLRQLSDGSRVEPRSILGARPGARTGVRPEALP